MHAILGTKRLRSKPPMLTRRQIELLLKEWYKGWNRHDLDHVMALFHNDIVFVNWDGRSIVGKKNLERAWRPWFINHNNFSFTEIETFIDEGRQKVLFRWILDWTPPKMRMLDIQSMEKREGVDVLHFCDGEIIKKLPIQNASQVRNKMA
jgi:hypothetical protein